jgi:hypothetical protein
MQFVLWALFCAILYLATIIAGAALYLKEVGVQLHRIAFWTEWVCDGKGKEQNKEDG